jgi:hypothetical protein
MPPEWVPLTLASRLDWSFPDLEGIVCAPTLRPDGVVLATPGHDRETGLYLDLNGIVFPAIPAHPTKDDAVTALTELYEPFRDFPFAHEYGISAALAAVLSLVGRSAIPGPVPAFPVRSNTAGSGKGLLVDTIATTATGRIAPHWPQVKEEEEDRKRLLTIAMSGDSVIHIDNCTLPFGNGALDSALTTMSVTDRLLGVNEKQEAAWLAVMFISGNNMMFAGDMARRVVPIDLDPKMEKPEERTGFEHARLLEWVRQERPRLVVAALTVLKAFFTADCPKQPGVSEFGSFEAWSDLVRHALIWAGCPDPCEGRKNIQAESDGTYEALATLLQCWCECYGHEKKTLKVAAQDIERRKTPDPDAINPANEWNGLHDALSAFDPKYDGKRLDTKRIGNALRTIEGRVISGQRLIRAGEYNRAALWKIETL